MRIEYPDFTELKPVGDMKPMLQAFEASKDLLDDAYRITTSFGSVGEIVSALMIYFSIAICTTPENLNEGFTEDELEQFVVTNELPLKKFVAAITRDLKLMYVRNSLESILRRK